VAGPYVNLEIRSTTQPISEGSYAGPKPIADEREMVVIVGLVDPPVSQFVFFSNGEARERWKPSGKIHWFDVDGVQPGPDGVQKILEVGKLG